MMRGSQIRLGLRGRLIALVLIGIVPMLIFAGMLLSEVAMRQRGLFEARIEDTARSLTLIVDQELARCQAVVTALAASHLLDTQNLEGFYGQASRVAAGEDRWIILFDREGRQIVNTKRPFGADLNEGIRPPIVEQVWMTGEPAVTDRLEHSPFVDKPVVATAVPVMRETDVLYVLMIVIRADKLSDALAMQGLPQQWTAAVLDREGRIIARNRAAERFVGKLAVEPLRRQAAEQDHGMMLVNTLEGEPAYAAFKRSGLSGWVMAVGAPQSIVDAPRNRSLALLLVGGLGLLLIGVGLAAHSARHIAAPVRLLRQAATTLGRGGVPAAPVTGIQEINEVGKALTEAGVELRERQARLRAALDVAAMGIWRLDIGNNVMEWDAATNRIMGRGETATRHEPTYFLQFVHPDDQHEARANAQKWLERPRDTEGEFRIIWPDGSVRWIYERGKLHTDENGRPAYAIGAIIDITERKRTEEALAAAHSRTLDILESITDAFYALDGEWRITYANRRALEWWGKRAHEVIGHHYLEIFPMVRNSEAYTAQVKVATERQPLHMETISPVIHRWISLSIYPTTGGGITVYFRDISARKSAEQRQALLMGELNHRVKNTLATVQSIIAQGLRGVPDPQTFARSVQGRLMALSAAHDLLTQTAWEGADLAATIRAALAPFDGGKLRLHIEGPPLTLWPNAAVALSMAFHELATNAAKYGALSNAEGCVSVTWTIDKSSAQKAAIIRWQESGGPPVKQPDRRGFGSRLIEWGLAHELESEVKLEFLSTGVVCMIRVPFPAKLKVAQ